MHRRLLPSAESLKFPKVLYVFLTVSIIVLISQPFFMLYQALDFVRVLVSFELSVLIFM